ncbi:MAG: hypothetical protein GY757_22430, partial [bacterium]|nr:hypothetical protein [bacterium]
QLYLRKKRTPEEIFDFLITYYERDLLNPHHIFQLAIACRLSERYDEAVSLLKKTLINERTREKRKNMEYELGLTLLQKKEPGNAVLHLRNSLKRTSTGDPLKKRVYFRLGEAFTGMKQYPAAVRALKKCRQLCPGHIAAKKMLETIDSFNE